MTTPDTSNLGPITKKEIDALIKAYKEGVAACEHDCTPGNFFRSAWPAAKDHGYADGVERDMFTTGYLSAMTSPIIVGPNARTL